MKILKIISANIIFAVLAIVIIELAAFYIYYKQHYNTISQDFLNPRSQEELQPFIFWAPKNILFNKDYFTLDNFRKPSGLKYKKSSIVLAGCSFTYGEFLKSSETFSYILSKYAEHPVFNIGLGGASPRETLYILKNNYFRNKLLKNTDNIQYFIYTYIPDQLCRLYADVYRRPEPVFLYDKTSRSLKYFNSKYTIFRSYFYFLISRNIAYNIDKNKKFKLFQIYMNELNKEIQKHFSFKGGKTKLVVFVYDDYIKSRPEFLDEGIIIINAADIVHENLREDKYRTADHLHPSAAAWEIIVPQLVKKLEL